MNLVILGTIFLHIYILTISYGIICKIARKERYWFGIYLFLFQLLAEFCFDFISLSGLGFEKFLFPIFLYAYLKIFKKYDKYQAGFISILLSLLYNSSHTFISVTLSSITGDQLALHHEELFFFVVLSLTYFTIKKIITYFHLEMTYFDKDYLYPFLKNMLVAFFTLHILLFISDIVSTFPSLNSFGSILSSIVFVCLLLIFFSMNSHKVQIEKEIELEQKKFEQKHLQTYTDEIVTLYNEIRGFRHDYTGMLISLRMAIESKDLQEIDRVYSEVLVKANQKLRSDKYTYFDLNNIEDSALRSLIAQSIVNAKTNDVEYTLEVKDIITPLSMELLDLVRVMSVLLNNAVEGAVESYQKQLEVAIIKLDLETLVVIQNSCKKRKVKSEDLFELGFSTKGRHRGLGLNNVKEILGKYDNVILETEIDNDVFKQVIRFKRELI
ncbi:competence system sensor histidine kinase ComD [Streptococcus taonis]|uniref:Competence system sensor histidine kinase ComD n=1 Tax=Streptococcus taonis TaxID=3041623 RepID=A0ABT6PFL9_9STRE|nr:competence system sensor histidine kinase ComD [Streptococcus sp. ST22-14]MDI1474793.1 competence system sensor histidine kinase ComD [Streptococcus sp. ST22-14]